MLTTVFALDAVEGRCQFLRVLCTVNHQPGCYSAEIPAQQEISSRGTCWPEIGRSKSSKLLLDQ
ncbi:hypothetical protein ACS0TY_003786 [Phlomoides rotata]